jgi:hypothetical protein
METTVSQSVGVRVDPATAFQLYTGGINRWWKRDSWYWNDRAPTPDGTLVTIGVRGWERLTDGPDIARGYGEGAKELLSWYAEAAAR